jgi:hypothetical protein
MAAIEAEPPIGPLGPTWLSWPLTQIELGAVALGDRTLVHISCLLVAVGFQRGAHYQPAREERTVETLGRNDFWQRVGLLSSVGGEQG